MTGLQEIQDSIYEHEAALLGKRLELDMAQGELDTARQHKQAMYQVIQARRAFRISISEDAGECFFEASGRADRITMAGTTQ